MVSKPLFINASFLENKKWVAIFNMLSSGMASWEIIGERIDGVRVTEKDVKFVCEKTKFGGNSY